jgi:hypothetical protein
LPGDEAAENLTDRKCRALVSSICHKIVSALILWGYMNISGRMSRLILLRIIWAFSAAIFNVPKTKQYKVEQKYSGCVLFVVDYATYRE